MDTVDVLAEYVKLFGAQERVCLFDSEEEFQNLLKDEPDVSTEFNPNGPLPFDGLFNKRSVQTRVAKEPVLVETHNESLPDKDVKTKTYVKNNPSATCITDVASASDVTEILDSVTQTGHTLYYLYSNADKKTCMATAHVDDEAKTFVLHKNSLLSLYIDRSSSPTYSVFLARAEIIKTWCTKEADGFRLNRDIFFNSPDTAAWLVLGLAVDGYMMWKDGKGRPLMKKYQYAL